MSTRESYQNSNAEFAPPDPPAAPRPEPAASSPPEGTTVPSPVSTSGPEEHLLASEAGENESPAREARGPATCDVIDPETWSCEAAPGVAPFNPPPPPPPDLNRGGWRGPLGANGRPRGMLKGQGKFSGGAITIHWWYERLADWMIANPHLTMKDAALEFNKTHHWILTLKNSDTFQRYWRERSEGASAECVGEIRAKAFAAAEASLDLLNEKLEVAPHTFTATGLLEVVDTTMKRFGYETNARSSGPVVNVNVGLVSPAELEAARERMRGQDPRLYLSREAREVEGEGGDGG